MHRSRLSLPLNAVRAFDAAARLGSIKAAATELGVTASAVSHQVKQLEAALSTRLFTRRSNALDLNREGARFFESVSPAIAAVERAGLAVGRPNEQILLRVSASLAARWLPQHLANFAAAHPRVSVAVETARVPVRLEDGVDLAISYARADLLTPDTVAFLPDMCQPVASPGLRGLRSGGNLVLKLPLISATRDDWDWRVWAQANGIVFSRLRIAHRFDADHVALAACIAGLRVFLSTLFMIETEIAQGCLVPVGDYEHRSARGCERTPR